MSLSQFFEAFFLFPIVFICSMPFYILIAVLLKRYQKSDKVQLRTFYGFILGSFLVSCFIIYAISEIVKASGI